jgi:hypothetical protein
MQNPHKFVTGFEGGSSVSISKMDELKTKDMITVKLI